MDEDRNDDTWAAHRRFAPLIPSVLSGIKRLLFAIKTVYLGSTSLFWEHVLRNVLEGKRNKRHLMLLWFIIKKKKITSVTDWFMTLMGKHLKTFAYKILVLYSSFCSGNSGNLNFIPISQTPLQFRGEYCALPPLHSFNNYSYFTNQAFTYNELITYDAFLLFTTTKQYINYVQ